MNSFLGRLRGHELVVCGTQPFTSSKLRLRSVASGYIANQNSLCCELGIPLSATPSEVLAWAYRRYGLELCSRVWGEWAAALFDEQSGELMLTHDALGCRTLFYSTDASQIVFASNLADLLSVMPAGPLNDDYVVRMLMDVSDQDESTPWLAFSRLPQCFSASWHAGNLRLRRTYDPAKHPSDSDGNATELALQARAWMVEAVVGALPATGRVWCELSGGLDSSSVVAIAAGELALSIETFSVVYSRSREADESHWIARVLAAFPVRSHQLDADGVPPFSLLPTQFHPEPTGSSLIMAFNQARMELLRAHGVQVMLTGMCGDAVFLGDSPQPYYLAGLRNPLALLRELGNWADRSPLQRPMGYWFQRFALRPHWARQKRKASRMGPPAWLSHELSARWYEHRHQRRQTEGLAPGDAEQWERVLKAATLARGGQHELEEVCSYRNPWLYLPLVEFMARVPWPLKLQPDLDRVMHRKAMTGLLPPEVCHRRDKKVPTQAFFTGLRESETWLKLLKEEPLVLQRGYVKATEWVEAVDQARHGFCQNPGSFLAVCMLESWLATLPPGACRRARFEIGTPVTAPGPTSS